MSDSGNPFVLSLPDTMPVVETYNNIASKLVDEVEKLNDQKDVNVNYDPAQGKVLVDFEDGKVKKIDPFELRCACMCAACIDEIDGR